METTTETRLRETYSRIPLFADQPFESATIKKVGGLTNRNYLVTADSGSYVMRVPGEGTEEYVDRAADEQAGRITSDLGVNAELVFYESGTGVQLTRFIENAKTLSPEDFQDLEICRRAGQCFSKVQNCGQKFLIEFNDKDQAQDYLKILKSMDARLPEGYEDLQKEAQYVRDALAVNAIDLVPSNNDPVPENFMNTTDKMFLLDWEFGGNNDIMWDLGDLSVEGNFGEEQDRAMLEAYCGGAYPNALYSRMILQKSMVFLLWTLWGALQVANKNPLKPSDIHYPFDDFWDYTMDRFTRCQEILNSSDFGTHIDNVKK
jgi:thiamine kinase-like enzyme